jgi:ApbE superfamily uncharacterized protein (UPF0280 family)
LPLGAKRRHDVVDIPIEGLVVRVSGGLGLEGEIRAAGMQAWEQIQAYRTRDDAFRLHRRPVEVPESAPPLARRLADTSAVAGVGPRFALRGALVDAIGLALTEHRAEFMVTCAGEAFVAARHRARLTLLQGSPALASGLAVVVGPDLGPVGIYATSRDARSNAPKGTAVTVVATTCVLADAAAAGSVMLLSRRGFRAALSYLQRVPGVHGGVVVQDERIGFAGALELAA